MAAGLLVWQAAHRKSVKAIGTRTSIFFAVTDSAEASFASCTSLKQWYELLSTPEALHGVVYLNVGESISCWRAVLEGKTDDPIYSLFYGTLDSGAARGKGRSGDPDGYFFDSASLARANSVFRRLDANLLRDHYDGGYFGDLQEQLRKRKLFSIRQS